MGNVYGNRNLKSTPPDSQQSLRTFLRRLSHDSASVLSTAFPRQQVVQNVVVMGIGVAVVVVFAATVPLPSSPNDCKHLTPDFPLMFLLWRK